MMYDTIVTVNDETFDELNAKGLRLENHDVDLEVYHWENGIVYNVVAVGPYGDSVNVTGAWWLPELYIYTV